MECKVWNLGLRKYMPVYNLQKRMVKLRVKGEIGDTLILVEHPPVITIGREGTRENILVPEASLAEKGIKVFEIDRGGDVTLHCPGQLVAYPILNLNQHGRDLHKYLRNLEIAIIRLLKEYGIMSTRETGHTGVWVNNKNIASIGIGCKHWVTFHGFALNVNPSLAYFSLINPCGIPDGKVTSITEVLHKDVSFKRVCEHLIYHFGEVFHLQMREDTKDRLDFEIIEALQALRDKLGKVPKGQETSLASTAISGKGDGFIYS